MMKYFASALAVLGLLAMADSAQARGRHGGASCGGCPGGVCSVPMGPAPMAPPPGKSSATDNAPPAVAAAAPAPAAAVAPTTAAPAQRYYANSGSRRGRFGWRR